MHMTTFNQSNDGNYGTYDNRSKANSDGKIFYLSSVTNDLNNQAEQDNQAYNLSRIDRYDTSCASTARLVNNYEIIGNGNDSFYTSNNYSTPSGKFFSSGKFWGLLRIILSNKGIMS
jgi:hypothetical protein